MSPHLTAICLAEARSLAANGNDEAVLELLNLVPAAQAAPLRARIYCRRGQFAKSVQHWQEALAAEPSNEEAKRGLALAQSFDRSRVGWFRLHARRWVLALALIVVVISVGRRVASQSRPAPGDDLAASLSHLHDEVKVLDQRTRETTEALRRVEQVHNSSTSNERQTGKAVASLSGQLRHVQQSLDMIKEKLPK
jgi:uncharacterized protein YoxC